MSKRVFISYARANGVYALKLAKELRAGGFDLWIDQLDIPTGARWDRAIEAALDECPAFLILLSPAAIESDNVLDEVGFAIDHGKAIVPVLFENCRIPLRLRRFQYIDITDDPESGLARCREGLGRLLPDGAQTSATSASPLGSSPTALGSSPSPPGGEGRGEGVPQSPWSQSGSPPHPTPLPRGERGPVGASRSVVDRSAEGRIKVDAAIVHGAADGWFMPGAGKFEWFQDIPDGPEMVVVPTGSFLMGSPDSEPGRLDREGPQHSVTIVKPFAVGRHAITRGQFAAFVNDTGHKTEGGAWVKTDREYAHNPKRSWRNPNFPQDDMHPVVCVNWNDAKAYADWLLRRTGKPYRLLSEAEWEYAARAGTTTPFWWGATITPRQANYNGNSVYKGGGAKGEYRKATVPVGNFEANPWGLFNVHGNCWEWCEDIWHDSYNSAPSDGSTWLRNGGLDNRIVRGGSWGIQPQFVRSAYRGKDPTDDRHNNQGFRLGRTLTP